VGFSGLKVNVLLTGVQLKKAGLAIAAIPYFTFFAWYYIFSYYILSFLLEKMTGIFYIYNASFNLLISLTLVLSCSFIRRIDKTSLIYAWSILSSVGTIYMILAPTDTLKLTTYLLLGVVFGIGLLAFLSFFWDLTVAEERGRVAGSIGVIFLPVCSLFIALAASLDLCGTATLCILLNLGTLAIKQLNTGRRPMLKEREDVREYNPEKRTIALYLIPWTVFSFINATLTSSFSLYVTQHSPPSHQLFLMTLQVVGGGLGALVGGVLADFFGRRLSLAAGLTLYGVSSAISGLTESYELLYLAFIGTGLTWGILMTVCLFVIWGDLATAKTCERRYSVGLAIFYLAASLGSLLSHELVRIPLMSAAIISCLLIFLSNIPLILAPELLSTDFREEVRIKLYVSLVRKIAKSRKSIAGQSRKC